MPRVIEGRKNKGVSFFIPLICTTFALMNYILGLLKLLSRLPFRVLYMLSDISFPILYYVVRYRRDVVRQNLDRAFPELDQKRRRYIERRFYRWFCDYAVETLKLITASPDEMRQRMQMEGTEEVEKELETHPFVIVYLGHFCNWEWISTLPLWMKQPETRCAQLYRPLKEKAFDGLFYEMRTRFGAENISKYEALRHILELKRREVPTVIGFISDQAPGWNSIHDWVDFLHQDTPVFTGPERIAKKVDAAVYFADVQRVRRGYYKLVMKKMTSDVKAYKDYQLTELYMKELEAMIRRQPYFWLWSHRRWKHQRNADGTRKEN